MNRCFARCWSEHAVMDRTGGERTFDHLRQGRFFYEQVAFAVATTVPISKLLMLVKQAGLQYARRTVRAAMLDVRPRARHRSPPR